MKVFQVVQSHHKSQKVKDSLVRIAEAFEEAFDWMGVDNETVRISKAHLDHSEYPEYHTMAGIIRSKYWLPAMRDSLVLCHEWGALIPLRLVGCKRIVQAIHTHHRFDQQADILKHFYPFADYYMPADLVSCAPLIEANQEYMKRCVIVRHPHRYRTIAGKGFDVVWVGRDDKRKNLGEFLDALRELPEEFGGLKIGIFLSDKKPHSYKTMEAAHPGVELHFGQEAEASLMLSKIFVSTSLQECCPRTVIAAGLGGAQLVLPDRPWTRQFGPWGYVGPLKETLLRALKEEYRPRDDQRQWFHERYTPKGQKLQEQLKDAYVRICQGVSA